MLKREENAAHDNRQTADSRHRPFQSAFLLHGHSSKPQRRPVPHPEDDGACSKDRHGVQQNIDD